jgi:hypothetical protein
MTQNIRQTCKCSGFGQFIIKVARYEVSIASLYALSGRECIGIPCTLHIECQLSCNKLMYYAPSLCNAPSRGGAISGSIALASGRLSLPIPPSSIYVEQLHRCPELPVISRVAFVASTTIFASPGQRAPHRQPQTWSAVAACLVPVNIFMHPNPERPEQPMAWIKCDQWLR